MTAKKTPTPPAPPKTPAKATKAETPDVPEKVEELPRKFKVKHKKTGNTFEVNADYYNRNKGILERV